MAGLGIDRYLGVEEEARLTPRFLIWAEAGGVPYTVKGNIKAVSTQCQAYSKYLVMISYNYYHKFSFRYVVLDKYPVGSGIYGSSNMVIKRLNVKICIDIGHSALNTIGSVNLSPLPLSLM